MAKKQKKEEVTIEEVAPVEVEETSAEASSVSCPENKEDGCCGTPESCLFQVAEIPVVETVEPPAVASICNVSASKVTVRLSGGDLRLAPKQCEKVLTESLTDAARLLEASGRIVIQNL